MHQRLIVDVDVFLSDLPPTPAAWGSVEVRPGANYGICRSHIPASCEQPRRWFRICQLVSIMVSELCHRAYGKLSNSWPCSSTLNGDSALQLKVKLPHRIMEKIRCH
jgi:hypothetical protein